MAANLFDLTGATALVTGGAGVYGASISEALAQAGAHVIIASRDLDACDRVATTLRGTGSMASAEQYDQAREESILALRDRLQNRFESIDVLVNNSVARPMRHYEDPLKAWQDSMDVNATGLFAISRAAYWHGIRSLFAFLTVAAFRENRDRGYTTTASD